MRQSSRAARGSRGDTAARHRGAGTAASLERAHRARHDCGISAAAEWTQPDLAAFHLARRPFIVFDSDATNLGSWGEPSAIYRRDRATGYTERPFGMTGSDVVISGDGFHIAFVHGRVHLTVVFNARSAGHDLRDRVGFVRRAIGADPVHGQWRGRWQRGRHARVRFGFNSDSVGARVGGGTS